jgi:hypothetical protein
VSGIKKLSSSDNLSPEPGSKNALPPDKGKISASVMLVFALASDTASNTKTIVINTHFLSISSFFRFQFFKLTLAMPLNSGKKVQPVPESDTNI